MPHPPKDDAETRTLRVALRSQAVRARPRVLWEDEAGPHAVVVDRPMLVGSASNCELVIRDATVSRLHAELDPKEDGLWVRDLGSHNGTFVNDALVSAARVTGRDRVRIGSTLLTLEGAPAESPVDLWPEPGLGDLVGGSAVMRELYATLVRVGASEAAVLIRGETGTGKELVARAIHECSHRASAPLVIVDCAALPETLLESELFGHAKGAFTGAATARAGAIEDADGGTVFLDEVGELPLAMQPKLLRVLESRTIRRVGESAHRRVNVRFLAATHRDLRDMVNAGNFREDLYFRLAVVPISVPPLRERTDDLPGLVAHFAPAMPESERAELCRVLASRRIEGNVRELRNVVERASLLGHDRAIEEDSGGGGSPGRSEDAAFAAPFHDFQNDMEREYVRRLLDRHAGNVSLAAQTAGINRTYLYRLIRKHAL